MTVLVVTCAFYVSL